MNVKNRSEVMALLAQAKEEGRTVEYLQPVKDIVSLFYKVLRGFKLYPITNPVFKSFANEFKAKLEVFHEKFALLPLTLSRSSFIFNGDAIESSEDEAEIIFVLFNDGIRELFFHKGITYEEILAFFEVVSTVTSSRNDDYDVVTLLWDKDFQSISYITDDELRDDNTFNDDDFSAMLTANLEEFEKEEMIQSNEPKGGESKGASSGGRIDISRAYQVNNIVSEKYRQKRELHNENAIINDFIKALSEQILIGTDASAKKGLVKTGLELWKKLLFFGALKESVYFITAMNAIGSRIKSTEPLLSDKIERDLEVFAEDDFINQLFHLLDNTKPEEYRYFAALIALIPAKAAEKIIIRISALPDKELRVTCLKKIADKKDILEYIKPLFTNSDWHVVRNALFIAKFSKNPDVIPYLRQIINHPQEQIRFEALSILAGYSAEEALPAFEKAIMSDDKRLRMMAIAKVCEIEGGRARMAIDRFFRDDKLKNMEISEVEEALTVLFASENIDVILIGAKLLHAERQDIRILAMNMFAKLKDTSIILKHIERIISDQNFEKMDKDELSIFMLLVKPPVFKLILPQLEKVFLMQGKLFNKNAVLVFKKIVIFSIARYKSDPLAAGWLKRGMQIGSSQTKAIIDEAGRLV